jgi:riboflavin kinase / FMN adenylyltransferase
VPDRDPVTVAGVEGLRSGDGPIFAVIGVFDGIHRGHQYLLRHLHLQAEQHQARPTVITFDAHPDEVILGAAPPLLLDPAERLRLLGEARVEVVVVQHFDSALRATEYDEFLGRITSRTRLAGLLMTPDAAFGHDRRGTPETVAALGERQGFDLVVRPPFLIDDRPVRSSDIRAAIADGSLDEAEHLLGRPHAVSGFVDDAGRVSFAMPVALPRAGSHAVNVTSAGGAEGAHRATLTVDAMGWSLDPAPTAAAGPVRIAFGEA